MSKSSNTELLWKIEALERKLAALTDLTVFMASHLSDVSPAHADELLQELHGLTQIDGVSWTPEFLALIERMRDAFHADGLHLDSMKLGPKK